MEHVLCVRKYAEHFVYYLIASLTIIPWLLPIITPILLMWKLECLEKTNLFKLVKW